jgi:anti-sigma B factor antagonist
MRMEERLVNDITIVTVFGDIVLSGKGRPQLAERVRALVREGRRRIVVDVSDVRGVDSGGIGELVEAFSAAQNRGGSVRLCGVTARLKDVLVLTGLLNVFGCFETEAETIASFDPSRDAIGLSAADLMNRRAERTGN